MEEEKKEEVFEEKEKKEDDDFLDIKEMQKTQELKKMEEGKNENLDNTFVKEVKEAAAVPAQEKKKGKGIGIVLVLLLLLVLGGLGVVFGPKLLNEVGKKEKDKTIETDSKKVSSSYRLSGNGLEDFDIYFLQLENEEKNKVYSPLSIKYALEMLSEGAKGDTKKQIDAVIGDYKANTYPNNEHMSFANAMFVRNAAKEKIISNYITNLKDKYGAEIIYDDFTSAKPMNDWVSNKTFNLINNLLKDDQVKDEIFVLINALAIDMNWKNQIHCTVGHKVPCLNTTYSVSYAHEKLEDDAESSYSVTEYPYDSEDYFYARKEYLNRKHEFNGKEFIKGGDILADYNRYDIIKDLGEDKIRKVVKPKYEEWLQTDEGKQLVKDGFYASYYPASADEYLNKFIEELKANNGKGDTTTDFSYYENDDVKAFAKDLQEYDGKQLQYVGIMPKTQKLADYIDNIKAKDVSTVISNLKETKLESFQEGYVTRIRGYIPFFKFEYELQLLDDLKKLGIEDVFDKNKADLSNMLSDSKDTFIGEAVHKANIEFSNDGIKAAAATSMGGFGSTSGGFDYLFKVPVIDIDITFNQPYMYIVRDKDTGEVWFTGTVYEPISQ